MTGIIFLCITVVIVLIIIGGYNNGVKLRNYVREAFSTMDVYLKKRWDLIPNLVETVKGYAEHEKELFEKLTELRSGNYSTMSELQKIEMNSELTQILSRLIAVAENYPELKANQNFMQQKSSSRAIL